eukprot:Blabericola_migrator_1__5013@NODE_25_length_21156_cov_56_925364_g22_i0_p3_GENE_NODE_25_length_21156_cov_56_925364_g22_i0NODE_25_length_21156_cov_56_925364_g22_i0_p3_ORF_typecomplete_len435_score65_13Peptidase_M48_N/PF16491_5/1_3e53Peptidase_M48_N/PF16491_5/2_2e03Peptidase_M48/PF01435_18/4e45Peptidase_M56/PF05569_11/2_9e02Peptidase_M56/PF05569_11/2_7e12Peptidase_M56/PF05569_11/84Peptidase_U49/PF10463_9/0_036Peptidase_M78/PF06114_13/0_056PHO4/PF01384_20/1_2e03PHO4/PF01384_20/0_086PHO4/PF01384_20/2
MICIRGSLANFCCSPRDMNWLWYGVTALVTEELFDAYLRLRQLALCRRRTGVPSSLKGIISEVDVEASNKYNADKLLFGIINSLVDLAITVTLLVGMVIPKVWHMVEQWTQSENEYVLSLTFLGLAVLITTLWGIPWELYADFVIEEKHGFNRKTIGLFIKDELISLALTVVIGSPLVLGCIKVVRWAGPDCYIYLWIATIVLTFVFSYIVPWFIMPLFNKFEPLHDAELKRKVEELAGRIGFPLSKLYQMDGSKRSTHSNAFMYGFWNNKIIVLYDTLLEFEHKEVLAVLGHELGHWKLKHTLFTLLAGFAQSFVIFYLLKLIVFRHEAFEDFGFGETRAVVIGLMIFGFVASPVGQIFSWIMNVVSRMFEFQADRFASSLGYTTDLRSALVKLGLKSRVIFNPDKLYAWMTYTHPTLEERLEALSRDDKRQN